jgi:hypothetical protein
MVEPIFSEEFKREASKEDPGGFANLEALTKRLLSAPKANKPDSEESDPPESKPA